MDTGTLYKLNRGNQNQTIGLIIKGATASVQVFGSQSKPTSLSDMEDMAGRVLESGAWTFRMLPEHIYLEGTADSIDIVNMSATDLKISL